MDCLKFIQNIGMSNASAEAKVIELFLKSMGVSKPYQKTDIGHGLFQIPLNTEAQRFFKAKPGACTVLGFQNDQTEILISILFLTEQDNKMKFGHCSLLTPAQQSDLELMGRLAALTQAFFATPPERLLELLGRGFTGQDFVSLFEQRIFWDEPDAEFKTLLPQELASSRLPIFPTVFPFNNTYLKKLLTKVTGLISPADRVLVMGCGAGFEAALIAKKLGVTVDAVDVNPVAVANTQAIAQLLGVSNQVRSWTSDVFASVTEAYDVVLFNAPLAVDGPRDNDPNRFDESGLVLYRFFAGLKTALKPNGKMFMMSRDDLPQWTGKSEYTYTSLESFHEKVSLAIWEVRV